MKILSQSKSLRILSAVHHSDETLDGESGPWIPSLSRDVYVLSLGVYQDHYFDVEYDASAGMAAFWNLVEPGRSLDFHGFVLDMVEKYIETEKLSHGESVVLKEVDELMSDVLRFRTDSNASPEDKLAAVGQTLTAGSRNQAPTQFAAEFAAFRLYLADEAEKKGREMLCRT